MLYSLITAFTTSRSRTYSILSALIVLFSIQTALPIPHEIPQQEPPLTEEDVTDPDTFPSSTQDVDRFFNYSPPSTSSNQPPLWREENKEQTFKVIGRYGERFNYMDVDRIVSQVISNDSMLQDQSARLPLDPDALQHDLGPGTNDVDPSLLLMRQIQESLKEEQSKSSAEEIQGLKLALSYLAMAAVIMVVIFARR
jgi:hypothetical protein